MLIHWDNYKSDQSLYKESSQVFATGVFRNPIFERLRTKAFVYYPLSGANILLKLTGIPPHVIILSELKMIGGMVENLPRLLLPDIEKLLDDRTMGGTLSETRITSLFNNCLESGKMKEMQDAINELRGTRDIGVRMEAGDEAGGPRRQANYQQFLHMTDGRFRRVPPKWTFPQVNLQVAYLHWHLGDRVKKVCPVKQRDREDMKFVTRGRRNLNDFRWIMKIIDEKSRQAGLLPGLPSAEQVNTAYKTGVEGLHFSIKTAKGRVRSRAKLSWQSVVQLERKYHRTEQS